MFAAVTVADQNGIEDPREFSRLLDALNIDTLGALEAMYREKVAADVWQRRRLYAYERQLVIDAHDSVESSFHRLLEIDRAEHPPEYVRLRNDGIQMRKHSLALLDAEIVLTEAAQPGTSVRAAIDRAIDILAAATLPPLDATHFREPTSIRVSTSASSSRRWRQRLIDLRKQFPHDGIKDDELAQAVKKAGRGLTRSSRIERDAAELTLQKAAELEAARGPDVLEDGTDLETYRAKNSLPEPEALERTMRYATSIDRRLEKDVAALLAIRRERRADDAERLPPAEPADGTHRRGMPRP